MENVMRAQARFNHGGSGVLEWLLDNKAAATESKRADEILSTIAQGTAADTGDKFFRSLVYHLAAALQVRYAFVAEFINDNKRARILAFWSPEGYLYHNFEFDPQSTPCESILRGETAFYRRGVRSLFPHDQGLAELKADSYLAIPLADQSGRVIGHLAALDTKPMWLEPNDLSIFKIFAARATAELQREQAEKELLKGCQELDESLKTLRSLQAHLVQSEKMAALGNLVAGVAHEINNPIGVINGSLDVVSRCLKTVTAALSQQDVNRETLGKPLSLAQKSIQVAVAAGARIAEIVKNLKNFARLDESAFKKADIHEGIENTLTLLGHQLEEKVSIVREFGDIPKINCFPNELNQVFMNILINAAQAIEDTGTIGIKTFQKNGHVQVKISDTGKGIAPENIPRIFEPGFTTKGVGVGTGLGLPISYNIIQKHKGEISVQSEIGKGTEFTIKLPA